MSKKESKPDIRKEIVAFAKERNCSVKQATIEVLKESATPVRIVVFDAKTPENTSYTKHSPYNNYHIFSSL